MTLLEETYYTHLRRKEFVMWEEMSNRLEEHHIKYPGDVLPIARTRQEMINQVKAFDELCKELDAGSNWQDENT